MNLIDELKEAKARIEALATTAAQVETLNSSVLALTGERDTLTASLATAQESATTLSAEVAALTETKATLEAQLSQLKSEKQETEDKALELVSELGLRVPVKVDAANNEAQSANEIRARYVELQGSNPAEAGRYFNENKDAILNGFRS